MLNVSDVRPGQTWERRDGTRFKIDLVDRARFAPGYARYWLGLGSRPQFRSVRLDLLVKNYRLVEVVR